MAKKLDFATSQIGTVSVEYPPANLPAVLNKALEMLALNGDWATVEDALPQYRPQNWQPPQGDQWREPATGDEEQAARDEQERYESSTFSTTTTGVGQKESRLVADDAAKATKVEERHVASQEAGAGGGASVNMGGGMTAEDEQALVQSGAKPSEEVNEERSAKLSASDLGLSKRKGR